MTEWIAPIGWSIFGLWALLLLPTMLLMTRRTLLRMSDSLPAPKQWPALSVIVPARDEGRNIEATLKSLLASPYPALEVIAVDDRSTDETGAIMDRAAAEDNRLQVIHVESLPDGWLGKNHAMHLAASRASGEYLLFTDGDILFEGDALRRAVKYVAAARIDHLCLMPRLLTGGYWECALTTYFGFVMAAGLFLWLVPTPLKWIYAGVGAFNLVRGEAYRQAGGHEALRLEVLDDVKLGQLMKQAGRRADILVAGDFVQVRWQESAAGVLAGLVKNSFAIVEFSLFRLSLATLIWASLSLSPYVAVALLPDARTLGFAAAIALLHTTYAIMAQRLGGTWLVLPVVPLAGLALIWAFWRSAWVTLRQGGVRWRETFYSLDELRQ